MRGASILTQMAEFYEAGQAFVAITIVEVMGSSPREVGARMLMLANEETSGTIGGGALEHQATQDALRCLASGTSRLQRYRLDTEGEDAIGARCGGEVTVFFEAHTPGQKLVIVGAGHIGQKLSALASMLEYRVIIVDSRAEMLTLERLPAADELVCAGPEHVADVCEIDQATSVVILTHAAECDRDALNSVIDSPARYVGMIGSARKIKSVFTELEGRGVAVERLAQVHAPIGLAIGAETPAELALCIMGEIVADRNGRLPVAVGPGESPPAF